MTYIDKENRYRVYWMEVKLRSKSFSVSSYGSKEAAFQSACEFRDRKIEELNQAGEGYTTRHGTSEKERNNVCS